jgi:hypothetical protein
LAENLAINEIFLHVLVNQPEKAVDVVFREIAARGVDKEAAELAGHGLQAALRVFDRRDVCGAEDVAEVARDAAGEIAELPLRGVVWRTPGEWFPRRWRRIARTSL